MFTLVACWVKAAFLQGENIAMANGTCVWKGASGTNYTFQILPRHPNINAGQFGNYIYAKKNASGYWVPVYIGQGDLSVRCSESHHQLECIDSKGATHIHMHLNSTEADRLNEEKDLLSNYANAYSPNGCNLKK